MRWYIAPRKKDSPPDKQPRRAIRDDLLRKSRDAVHDYYNEPIFEVRLFPETYDKPQLVTARVRFEVKEIVLSSTFISITKDAIMERR